MEEMTQKVIEKQDTGWIRNTMIVGGLLGALTGVGIAYMMVRRALGRQERLRLTPGDGVRLGLLLFGLLRSVGELGGERD